MTKDTLLFGHKTAWTLKGIRALSLGGAVIATLGLAACGDDDKTKIENNCVLIAEKSGSPPGALEACACVATTIDAAPDPKDTATIAGFLETMANGETVPPLTKPEDVNSWLLLSRAMDYCVKENTGPGNAPGPR